MVNFTFFVVEDTFLFYLFIYFSLSLQMSFAGYVHFVFCDALI